MVAADDPATTSGARSATASSGGGRRSTQVGEYAPETRPTSRQHQLQPPKQAAPALHSAHSACWIYVKTDMSGLAIYRPSSSCTVNSLIIENVTPIENGDFGRFLAFSLARIGIFL